MAAADITVKKMTLGMVQTNCYYVYREQNVGNEAREKIPVIVIDPADQGEEIYETLSANSFEVVLILLTHAHFDHILGVEALQRRSKAPVWCYEAERPLCEDPSLNVSADIGRPVRVMPDRYLKDLEMIEAADMKLQLIATPGHTVGSCCYYLADAGILFSGDTLFEESVGRTDLPTGSMSALLRSIKERLFVLPEKKVCYSGHTGATNNGHEKTKNCYL